MMEITSSIPIPEGQRYAGRGKRRSKYPFLVMEIGESVFFEGQTNGGPADSTSKKLSHRTNGAVKFTSRCENGGIRIWRIA